jgi:hypothetical protein
MMGRRSIRAGAALGAWLLLAATAASLAAAQGFVGETKCGTNPACHGGGLPAANWTETQRAEWRPWRSARTQWLQKSIDRHSRAYRTLENEESRAIAAYMGIEATTSQKCLVCHAPDAPRAAASAHRREDGVSCEHCHGAAEAWLDVHTQRDVWKADRATYAAKGFYDNDDLRLRAEKCASCHVEIDHEIVAGGHPPLQFEMVAYAQVMKHWDDQDELPPGAFSIDPTLWGIGQLVGLRQAVEMAGRRAGASDDQGLGKFPHFADRSCYQCHHKLVDDALRQAEGHQRMSEFLLETAAPPRKAELTALWQQLQAAARSDPKKTEQAAAALAAATGPMVAALQRQRLDQGSTRALLRRITAGGERLKSVRRFDYTRPAGSNVTRIDQINLPWWYTTGAPEQTILAILALCPPAYGNEVCGKDGIVPEIKALLAATDRFRYDPGKFAAALGRLNAKLPK